MGWLAPKTFLKWTEPTEVRSVREEFVGRAEPRWASPAYVLFIAGILMAAWWLSQFNPNNHPPPRYLAVPLCLGAGIIYAYLLPCLYRLAPSGVRVTEQGIVRVNGDHFGLVRFSDIRCCEIVVRSGPAAVALLQVTTEKSTELVGIAPTVPVEDLRRVLAERGVAVSVAERVGRRPELSAR